MQTTKQNSTQKKDLFTLINCTDKFHLSDLTYSNFPTTFNKVYVFHQAQGEHTIDNKKHIIKNSSIHFVSQGATSKLRLNHNINKITFLCFDNAFIENNGVHIPFLRELYYFLNDNRSPVLQLQKQFFKNAEVLLLQIEKEYSKGKTFQNFYLITFLQNFLLSIKRWNDETIADTIFEMTEQKIPNVLKKFIPLTDDHCKTHKHPHNYAEDLGITENHLNKLFHKHFSKTVHQFLDDKIIAQAKESLKNINISAKEIAFELNFKDAAYFNRFFKKHTGISVKQFRKTFQ